MKKNYPLKARVFLASAALFLTGWSARAQFPAPYCQATFTSNVEPITLVNFAGINNSSIATVGTAAMQDFTAITGTVTPTVTYPIILKGNTDGAFTNFFSVFIDWNSDADFDDANEGFEIGSIYQSTGNDAVQATGNITIPADAPQGNVRMRVVKRYNLPGGPCNIDGYGQTEDYTLIVTDPPACLSPTGVALSGVAGSSTADIMWQAPSAAPSAGYEYYYSTSATAPTESTPGMDAATATASLSDLTPNTDYYVWVRSDCGAGGYSFWSQSFMFRTACVAFNAPFTEQFSTGVKPDCWGNTSTNGAANALWKFSGFVEYDNGNTRPEGTFAWVDGSDPSDGVNDVTLTSPLINVSGLTTPQLLFDYFSNSSNTDYPNNILTVEVFNGTTWVNVFSDNTNSPVWRTITVPLAGYTGTIQVRFVLDKTAAPPGYAFYNDVLLDNVVIQETPACAPPTAIYMTDANPYDVSVQWTASSSAPSAGYDYELRTSGAAGSGATGLVSSGNTAMTSAVISSLTPDTDYTLYMRSNCGASVYSEWVSYTLSTIPVPPANDDCSGAVALTVNADYSCNVVTAGTTVNATESMEADPCYGNPDDDVWYSFVATSDAHLISISNIVAITGGSTDMYFQVLSGACGSMDSELCMDANTAIVDELVPGETYYIRVYSYYDSHNTFNICVGTDPGAPANDDCAGAVVLTVNPDLNCAVTTGATTMSATESMQADPCFGTPDDDVWFQFTATAESHSVSLTEITAIQGWSTDMYFQVLQGACDAEQSLFCSDNESNIVTGLTPGEVYIVRVYSYWGDSRQNFRICIGTPPAPPVNDDCAGAIALTVNPDLDCAVTTAGTTMSASMSMQADPCFGNPDDDVWYSFQATAESHTVSLSGITPVIGFSTDMYIQVLEGVCDSGVSIKCSDPESTTVDGLTPGETYYIRVYSYGTGSFQNFNICVGTMPDPPANDDCDGAIAIVPGAEFDTNPMVVSNGGATDSSGVNDPDCANYLGGDVWYMVEVPASGTLTIETHANAGSPLTDAGMAIYTGECGDFTEIACDDDSSDDGAFSLIELEDMTPGEILYIRLWEYGGDIMGSFRLSAYDASLSAQDFSAAASFKYYPNPVKNVLNLSYDSDITSVAVYNMLGQQVLAKDVNAAETTVDMSALADGAYVVNVTIGDSVKTVKVIKNQ
jgi:hypothetical protein